MELTKDITKYKLGEGELLYIPHWEKQQPPSAPPSLRLLTGLKTIPNLE